MVGIYPVIHYTCFLVYSMLAAYTLYKNPNAALNRVCSLLIMCFAVWSFGMIFVHNPASTKETARFFDNICSIGSCSFGSLTLWFALILTRNRRAFRHGYIYPFLALVPFILIYKQFTGWLNVDYVRTDYGWAEVWGTSFWVYFFYVYYISSAVGSLVIIRRYAGRQEDALLRRQALIIFWSILLALVLGTLTDVILPELGVEGFPDLGNVLAGIWAMGIVYAIVRYRFMSITPAMATENIIVTMPDALILLDHAGRITTVNKATCDLLGYSKGELEGRYAGIIFASENFERAESENVLKGDRVPAIEFLLKAKGGKNIPVSLSSSSLKDEAGKRAGTVCIARDITVQKAAEEELRRSEERFKQVADIAGDWIWELDRNGRFVFSSNGVIGILGYGPDEIVGKKNIFDFFHGETREKLRRTLQSYFKKKMHVRDFITGFEHREGRFVQLETCASPVLTSAGRLMGYRGVSKDITNLKRMEEQIRELSLIDEVSGAYNRRGFLKLAEQQLKLAVRSKRGLVALLVDIHDLKWINVNLSQSHGDQALADTAELLTDTFRRSDIVARVGGDEFVVLEIEAKMDSAEILVSRIDERLQAYNDERHTSFKLAFDYGTAYFDPEERCTIDELLARAEKSLAEYKARHRDR
jgi:diguanylate cyclase (GGDEF)-like protein/PAS domain S-box-containing protein